MKRRKGAAPTRPSRFVRTLVEIEGREETRVVEIPDFEPAPWKADAALTIVGRATPRFDAVEKSTGRARYTADVQLPGMLHAAIVRSHQPHGCITAVDVDAARAVPGVVDVLTGADLPAGMSVGGRKMFDRTVEYAGQPVAAVCAASAEAARRGAAAVRLTIEAAGFAVTFADATAPGAPRVRAGGNVAPHAPFIQERGNMARGLRQADVTISREYRTPVALHSALEPHGAVAEWTDDRLTVWESTQGIFRTREQLGAALRLPLNRVRVICEHMGGGFGAKNGMGTHTLVAALFARRSGRPVRCLNDREAEQTDAGNRNATVQRVTLAAKRDGRLTAILVEADVPLGVGGWESGPAKIYHELYRCPNVRTAETFGYINAAAMSAFRAPGHAEGAFGLERAMDTLAGALDMDPLALRMKNLAARDQEKGRPYSGGSRLAECYRDGAKRFGWTRARRANSATATTGARRGVGMAAQIWGTGGGPPAYALVRLNADGTADVLTGTQDLGTGSRTILAQVAAEALGARLADVQVILGDTERTPYTGNSWGSMTTPSVSPAVRMAAEDARRQLLEAAAGMMGVSPDRLEARGGTIRVKGKGRGRNARAMSFAAVAEQLGDVMIIGRGSRGPNAPHAAVVTVGAQFAEVEVDPGTGVVRVLRIVAVHDAGRVINPLLAGSQLQGGILQGLGYALFEERVMDRRLGVPLNPTLHDYKVPTMADAPSIDARCLDGSDSTANHVGARGLAEPPIIPTAPAIANAVANALGVEVDEIPLTPWRVLAALARRVGTDS